MKTLILNMSRKVHLSNLNKSIGCVIACTLVLSCNKLIQIDPPNDKLSTSDVFKGSSNATASVVGLYTSAMGASSSLRLTNGALSAYLGLAADELKPTNTTDPGLLAFYSNSLNNTTSQVSSFWAQYALIFSENSCVKGLAESPLKASIKNPLLGEVKFFRAFSYLHLVNLFGDVPLILSTDWENTAQLPRSAADKVYNQIVSDLVEAESLLPEDYVSSGRVRVNKSAAKALLARVYLYLKKYEDAEKLSSEIIDKSAIYYLEPELNDIFKVSSNEAIWQLMPTQLNYASAEGAAFIPSSKNVVPRYSISDTLYKSFELDDQRKSKWINKNTVSSKIYYYPYKYKIRTSASNPPQEYVMVLRLAEQYLIRAECRANLGKLVGSNSAEADLNQIRIRAGLPNTMASSKEDLLLAIAHERQIEFFCEWGHRWFDLKRTEKINERMSGISPLKGGVWSPNFQYMPIPLDQIQKNPNLKQNEGYK